VGYGLAHGGCGGVLRGAGMEKICGVESEFDQLINSTFMIFRKFNYPVKTTKDTRNCLMVSRTRFIFKISLAMTGCLLSTVCTAHLMAEDRDGKCHMTVDGDGQVFTVHVDGLKPGESLNLKSVSDGETLTSSAKARPDGSYGVTLFPAVEGRTSGKVTLWIKSSRCQLQTTFRWHN